MPVAAAPAVRGADIRSFITTAGTEDNGDLESGKSSTAAASNTGSGQGQEFSGNATSPSRGKTKRDYGTDSNYTKKVVCTSLDAPDHHRQSESTALLAAEDISSASVNDELNQPVSPRIFFFPPHNPTIQRYYRFLASSETPFAALHKRPGDVASSATLAGSSSGGVTGLLRRSAVLPSHGTDPTGKWILISVGGRSGWAKRRMFEEVEDGEDKDGGGVGLPSGSAVMLGSQFSSAESTMSQGSASKLPSSQGAFTEAPTFRVTEGWMGNHHFLFGGKVMLGSDAPLFFFTNLLLILGVCLHLVVVVPHIAEHSPDHWAAQPHAMSTSVVLFFMSLVTLWMSATTDPGIIPAVSSPIKPAVPDDGTPIGGPLGYRYCSTCNIFRPPRSKHCNSCNVCVSKFDHHCPWTGNCIGERNHHYFFVFLLSISALTALVTLTCIQVMVRAYQDAETDLEPGLKIGDSGGDAIEHGYHPRPDMEVERAWKATRQYPLVVLMGAFTLLCAWSLTSLTCFHALIITLAQTTNERVRSVYQYGAVVNAADRGCCANWHSAFFSRKPPSRLPPDFSQTVICFDSNAKACPECPREEYVWNASDVKRKMTLSSERVDSAANLSSEI